MKLTMELVPQPCWGKSLAKSLPPEEWDRLRRQVYRSCNYHCAVCGAHHTTVYCHEQWGYDEEHGVQKLVDLICLCGLCSHVKHFGHAGILAAEGKLNLQVVIDHFMKVNECSREEFLAHKEEAWAVWSRRNKKKWRTDYGGYTYLIE